MSKDINSKEESIKGDDDMLAAEKLVNSSDNNNTKYSEAKTEDILKAIKNSHEKHAESLKLLAK
jgi:hypothetical protein